VGPGPKLTRSDRYEVRSYHIEAEIVGVGTGLAGVIVGAIAAFVGQKYMADADLKRGRVGMVRALVSELQDNGRSVVALPLGGNATEYSNEVWRATRFELGTFLPGNLYDEIHLLYMTLPETSNLAASWLRDAHLTVTKLLSLPESNAFRESYQTAFSLSQEEPND